MTIEGFNKKAFVRSVLVKNKSLFVTEMAKARSESKQDFPKKTGALRKSIVTKLTLTSNSLHVRLLAQDYKALWFELGTKERYIKHYKGRKRSKGRQAIARQRIKLQSRNKNFRGRIKPTNALTNNSRAAAKRILHKITI